MRMFLVALLAMMVVATPVFADQDETTLIRTASVDHMSSSTASAGVIISDSVPWVVPANGSGYTRAFLLDNADIRYGFAATLLVDEVNSGTHYLYLQGSNDNVNYANIKHAIPVTAATTDNNMNYFTGVKATITATGADAVYFSQPPPYKYFRFHLDADGSNGPVSITAFSVSKY